MGDLTQHQEGDCLLLAPPVLLQHAQQHLHTRPGTWLQTSQGEGGQMDEEVDDSALDDVLLVVMVLEDGATHMIMAGHSISFMDCEVTCK